MAAIYIFVQIKVIFKILELKYLISKLEEMENSAPESSLINVWKRQVIV